MPRPTRRRALVDPAAGLRSWTLMVMGSLLLVLDDPDEVGDLGDHPADLRAIGQRVGLADATEAERPERAPVLGLGADPRAHLGDGDVGHHTCSGSSRARSLSRYAWISAPGNSSSGDRPLSLATSSGRRSALSPAMVARATLMWLDEPSDLHSTSRMPASSRMARAAPPAMTPVPGAAGFMNTRPAPVSPMIGWTMVVPASGTLNRFFRASSVPFWMARGTSLALP